MSEWEEKGGVLDDTDVKSHRAEIGHPGDSGPRILEEPTEGRHLARAANQQGGTQLWAAKQRMHGGRRLSLVGCRRAREIVGDSEVEMVGQQA